MSAAAIPLAELMCAAQGVAQAAYGVQRQVIQGRRLAPLESMHLTAMLRGVAHDVRLARELLQRTAAANDELAAPALA